VIPGNDDAIGSLTMISNLIAQALKDGKAKSAVVKAGAEAEKAAQPKVKKLA
jgi:ribosomal protein S2